MGCHLDRYGLSYFPVPKCACSSLKAFFFELENGRPFQNYRANGKVIHIHHVYRTLPFETTRHRPVPTTGKSRWSATRLRGFYPATPTECCTIESSTELIYRFGIALPAWFGDQISALSSTSCLDTANCRQACTTTARLMSSSSVSIQRISTGSTGSINSTHSSLMWLGVWEQRRLCRDCRWAAPSLKRMNCHGVRLVSSRTSTRMTMRPLARISRRAGSRGPQSSLGNQTASDARQSARKDH
jgi:hypothetical protein